MEQNSTSNILEPVKSSKRVVSALIDYLPLVGLSFVGSSIGMIIFFESFPAEYLQQSQMSDEDAFRMVTSMFDSLYVIFYPISISMALGYTYFLCKDLFGGRSLGKRSQKLQLVRLDGSSVSYIRMIIRNLFIIIWPVELIMYLANSGQRLGDLACNTTVVAATEDNRQIVDKQKVTITIIIVAVLCSFIAVLYYWGMKAIFDWYITFLKNIMQHQ